MKRILLFFITVNLISILPSFGQYVMPASGTMSVTACSGVVSDNGGPTGNYSNNYYGSITINPISTGSGISLDFKSFSIENNFDFLYIYDGVNISAPLIGQFASNPGTIKATNPSGALTILMSTDASTNYAGFTANISCISLPQSDLIIKNQKAAPSIIIAGKSTMLTCDVVNQGKVKADSSNVGYFISLDTLLDGSDVYLGSSVGGMLSAGGTGTQLASVVVPGNTIPGNYFILYDADFTNVQSESNENNNISNYPVTILAAVVDLKIQSFSSSWTNILVGSFINVNATISNTGNVSSPKSSIGYYLSADSIWDASDVYLGNSSGGILGNGNSVNEIALLTIPYASIPGNCYLLSFADYLNEIIETNENNNISNYPVTILAAVVDLKVQSFSSNLTNIAIGSTLKVKATLSNTGNVASPKSNIGYYLSIDSIWDASDVYLGNSSGGVLGNGISLNETASLTIPNASAPGNYYLLSFADYLNEIIETNETNNVQWLPISVGFAYYDIIIQSLTIDKSYVPNGGNVSVTCILNNFGNAVVGSSIIGYYLSSDSIWDSNDEQLSTTTITSINSYSPLSRSVTLTIPPATNLGNYYILLLADLTNAVSETNETNNMRGIPISVVPPNSDLTIKSIQLTTNQCIPEMQIGVSGVISNQGNSSASTSNVGYYYSLDSIWDTSDILLNYNSNGSLAMNASVYFSSKVVIPSTATPGVGYILFYADFSNVEIETDETNNILSKKITVLAPFVDLSIQNPVATPTKAVQGNSIVLSGKIQNTGTLNATSTALGFFLSQDSIFDSSDIFLDYDLIYVSANSGSNFNFTLTIPMSIPTGNYYLIYYADYSNVILETNELNNMNFIPVSLVSPFIDLVIQKPYLSAAATSPGGSVTVSNTILNQGNVSATTSNTAYYLSSDKIWDAADIYLSKVDGSSLSATSSTSQQTNVSIPTNVSLGSYYLLFFADYSNTVTESNELNNVVFLSISILDEYMVPFSGSSSVTTCSGVLYDDGGAGAYLNNSNGYLTIYPGGTGNMVALNFNSFNVELWSLDGITIYNGINNSAPVLGVFDGYSVSNNQPGFFLANNSTGALTVKFSSDNFDPYFSGFDATISCLNSSALADLVIVNTSCSNASAPLGSKIVVSSDIENQGSNASYSNDIGYYLSSDSLLDASDLLLNFYSASPLAPSKRNNVNCTLILPYSVTAGIYYILPYIDYLNKTVELDETNNINPIAITITPSKADLTIANQFVSPTVYDYGNTPYNLQFSYAIINQGLTPADNFKIGYFLSKDTLFDTGDTFIGKDSSAYLTSGYSNYIFAYPTLSSSTPNGVYYILFVADYLNAVPETNEMNNVKWIPFSIVIPNVDLIIQSPMLGSSSAVSGNWVRASCQLINQGTTNSKTNYTGYYLSTDSILDGGDVLLAYNGNYSLAGSASLAQQTNLMIPYGTASGDYFILFVADYSGQIAETNELNNIQSLKFTVLKPTVDLVIGSGVVSNATVIPGERINVTNYLIDKGNSFANPSVTGYYLSIDTIWDNSDILLNTSSNTGVYPYYPSAQSSSPIVPNSISIGTYYIIIFADYLNSVSEVDESNNANVYLPIQVTSEYTIPVTGSNSISACDGLLYANGGQTGSYANNSNGSLTINPGTPGNFVGLNFTRFNLESCCDYVTIYDGTSTSAPVIATYYGSYYYYIPNPVYATNPTGALTIAFVSNATNTYGGFEAVISCQSNLPQPDLIVSSYSLNFPVLVQGGSVQVNSTIKNQGINNSSSSNIGYYLSADTLLDSLDILLGNNMGGALVKNAISSNNYSYVSIPPATLPGQYYILFVADYLNSVVESDETNNVKSTPITIQAAMVDLIITTQNVYPNSIPYGTSLQQV